MPKRQVVEPHWLDPEEMRTWRGFVQVFVGVQAELEGELLEQHGLTEGEYAVLVHLSEAEGRHLRMCDLASRLQLSPSGMTRRIDSLVKKGLVERAPAPDDRRVLLANLTPDGLAKLEAAAPDHVAGVRRHLIDHLSREDVEQLGDILDRARRSRADTDG